MKELTRILIVEDRAADADLAKHTIRKVLEDCEFQVVETSTDFLHTLEFFKPDVILSDYSLPRFDGMSALRLTLEHAPLTPLIIWTGSISEDVAVECMKAGANNYILKDNIKRLGPAVIHALEERQLLLERKQAEEKYQNIIENSVEGIFQSTPDGRYLNVNPAMARIYGYDSPQDMISSVKSIADQIYVDAARRNEFIQTLASQGIVTSHEEKNYRKDGSVIWTSTSARAVHDEQGNILYYEGFLQDITQRKEVEEALQNSEKRFRALIENGLDNISLLEADGTLIWESPAAVRMLAYEEDEFVGHDIFAIMHPDDLAWTRQLYIKLLHEPGGHQRGTFRLQRSDGTWRWVDAIVTNMLDEPSVRAIVVNYRDITESKQAEEALRESQARYQSLVETSHDLIWSVDAEGKITFLNRAAKEIYGYDPEELIGRSFFEIMDPEHYHKDSNKFFKTVSQTQELRDTETHVKHRDGREIILSANSLVLRNAQGNVIGVTGSSRDITDRKQMEDSLREERNLLRTLIDNIPDRIYAMDLEGRKTLSNVADWRASGGKTMEEILGKTDFEMYPAELAQDFWQLDKEVLEYGRSILNVEEPGLDADGNLVSILTSKIPLRDKNGMVIGLVGVGRDITERKRVDLERQTLLEIMQGLANAMDLQELLKQIHHSVKKVIYAENFFVTLYRQATGLFEEIYVADKYDPPTVPSKLEKSITSYIFRSGEPLLLTQERFDELEAQGEVALIGTNSASWLGAPLKTSGRTIGVIAVQDYEIDNRYSERDKDFLASIATQIALVIERKQAEEALRESEEHYRTIFEGVQDAIFVESVDGKILMVNDRACEMFGYSRSEFLTKTVEDIVPEGHLVLTASHESVTLSFEPRETVNQRANGETFPVEISGRLQEINGETVLLVVVRDITERKQAEEALHRSEALYRQAIEVAGAVPYYETYYDEGQRIKYEFIGEGIRQITGYGPEEFNASLWDSLVEEVVLVEDLAGYSLEEGIQKVRKGETSIWKCEHRLRDRDGKEHWVFEAAVELRDENGYAYGSIGTYQDITERKLAENKLRESEMRYRGLFENLVIGFALHEIVTDGEGQPVDYVFLEVNPAFEKLTGLQAQQVIGKSAREVLPGAENDRFIQIYGEVALTGVPAHFEQFSEQIGRYYEINAYSPRKGLFAVTFADITERKSAVENIRNAREFLQGVQNSLSAHIAILDQSGNIVQVNRAWRTFGEQNGLQYAEHGVGLNYIEICEAATGPDSEEAALVACAIRDVITGKKDEAAIEYPCHSPEQKRWFTLRVTKYENQEGEWVILAHENITERMQAEESIRAEREKAQNYLDIAGVIMLALDRNGIVSLINQKGCEILSYSPDEILGKDWINTFLPESTKQELQETFQQLITGNVQSVAYYENKVVTKSGAERLIAWHNTLLRDQEGNIISTLSSGEDITERRAAEIELKQKNDDLALLNAINEALVRGQDLDSIVELLANEMRRIFSSQGSTVYTTVYMLTPDKKFIRLQKYFFAADTQQKIERLIGRAIPIIDIPVKEGGHFHKAMVGVQSAITTGSKEIQQWIYEFTETKSLPSITRGMIRKLIPQIQKILNINSVICVPLISGGEIIGFLDISGSGLFNVNDQKRIEKIAGQLTAVIQRQRAEEAEREQRALAEALRDTAETLNSTLDYGEVLDHILAAAGRVVPHDAATIMLIEEGMARVVRSYGYDKRNLDYEVLGIQLPLAETSNLRQMFETGQTVVITDTHEYEGWKRLPETDWLRSNVGVPVSVYGRVIGFILLDSQTPGFFTPIHAERLEAFANQAAVAIHNADLLQQAQEEIAERIQAETQLRASEERFLQLADNIQEAFWMTDAESGEEIYLSPAAETIWERSIESLIVDPAAFINTVYPDDRPAILEAIEKEKNGEKVEIEYRIIRPNGSLRWVWDRAFPIFDESAKVKRIAGITADITERRESEMALVKSQGRYRELFDSSPISIWEEDYSLVKKRIDALLTSGITELKAYLFAHPEQVVELASLVKIVDANKAALELYGLERSEVLSRGLTQVVSKEAVSHFQEEILGFLSPSRRFTWEGTDKLPTGRQIEVLVTGSIPQGYEEDWSKVIVSVSDITERKQVEQQLRQLSRAVEQSASTIIITDTAGTIVYVNPKFTEITGYTFDEVIGQNPNILKSGLTPREHYRQLWQTITAGKEWHGELLNRKKNDELYWEHVTVSPIFNERGEITHFVGVKEDITQRKQNEVEIQRHLTELEALYENGLAVGRLLTTNEIGDRVISTFARYLQWHHVTIRLRKENSDELDLVALNLPDLREEQRDQTEKHFNALISRIGQGLSGWVIQTGLAVRTGNVHADPRYVDIHPGIKSGLYMPLKVGEQVIGVISVESEVSDAFTEQDERLLATMATQAAIAFENARLYETLQKELAERKRAEQDLRISETHYRELADSITDILFELDHQRQLTHWNKASEALTGIPANEAIGRSLVDVFGQSEDQYGMDKVYDHVLRDHQPQTFESMIPLNGKKHFFEINAYPSARGVSVVAKDITERKLDETLLQMRFQLMEYSSHHSLDEIMRRTIDELSELTESHIGFLHFVEPDQMTIGLQVWSTETTGKFCELDAKETHSPLEQAGVWADAIRDKNPVVHNDYESLPNQKGMPEGHAKLVREMVIPILRNEKVTAVIGVGNKNHEYTERDLEIARRFADYAWDRVERKQMEVALEEERKQLARRVDERTADLSRANSNLARALRVKDEFLANMSHELRTPLNAILGLSESLSEQIAGPLNEKQQKYISTISESGHHLLSLINDILDLAKIEAGQITLDINKVDIHSVCQASLRMIKQLAQKKNQEVALEIDAGLGLMWADERRLKQMIVNLLGNAVKFTPENGKLGLEVHGDEEANKISFTVWDRGIGIKQEDLTRLFQPFVQLDSGLARETTGTGLGLALVAQMARLHGGGITAVSEPENGSRFTIILPWEPALAMDAATRMKITGKFRAVKVDEANKPTILLVEDTKEVTMMVKDYLELTGYKVITAQDGVDAIVQAKLVKPDLILMDVQMPRMDGLEATRKLRSEPDFRYTPIIALTALAMPNDRERCLEAGMDEYISKPINLKALIKIIQSCLFGNQESKHS